MGVVWRTTEKTYFSVFPFFSVFSVVIHFILFANLGILMISKEVLHG